MISIRRTFALAVLSATLSLQAHAGVEESATARVQSFLAAFNKDDAAALDEFVKEAFSPDTLKKNPVDKLVQQFKDMKTQTGTLKLESMKADGNRVTARVTAEGPGMLLDLNATVGKEAPHYMTGLGAVPAK